MEKYSLQCVLQTFIDYTEVELVTRLSRGFMTILLIMRFQKHIFKTLLENFWIIYDRGEAAKDVGGYSASSH